MTQPDQLPSAAPPADSRRTTISVYLEDAEWLRALQREISFKRDAYMTMHDLVHELVARAKDDEKEPREGQ
jgi:hypothetical protein